jgi:hypothetical protein
MAFVSMTKPLNLNTQPDLILSSSASLILGTTELFYPASSWILCRSGSSSIGHATCALSDILSHSSSSSLDDNSFKISSSWADLQDSYGLILDFQPSRSLISTLTISSIVVILGLVSCFYTNFGPMIANCGF